MGSALGAAGKLENDTMAVSFAVNAHDAALIQAIALRADTEIFRRLNIQQTVLDTQMDLSACIAQGVPLRLQDLLEADELNFAHDVCGIRRHMDRETGMLGDCFLPRFTNN